MVNKITEFRGAYYFLSNFYEVPIIYDGRTYQNNEAAFQSMKCEKNEERYKFCHLSPIESKHLGRKVTLRKDWEQVKVQIMKDIVREKFMQNPSLKEKLLKTEGFYLEEGNTWGDKIWGIDKRTGTGRNLLGNILMETRDIFIRLNKDALWNTLSNDAKNVIEWVQDPLIDEKKPVTIMNDTSFIIPKTHEGMKKEIFITNELFNEIYQYVLKDNDLSLKLNKNSLTFQLIDKNIDNESVYEAELN